MLAPQVGKKLDLPDEVVVARQLGVDEGIGRGRHSKPTEAEVKKEELEEENNVEVMAARV